MQERWWHSFSLAETAIVAAVAAFGGAVLLSACTGERPALAQEGRYQLVVSDRRAYVFDPATGDCYRTVGWAWQKSNPIRGESWPATTPEAP